VKKPRVSHDEPVLLAHTLISAAKIPKFAAAEQKTPGLPASSQNLMGT
jgi:hypothetical protein